MTSANTIKKTLLSLGIDPKSVEEVKKLIAQLEKLQKTAAKVGKDFQQVVSQTKGKEIAQSARNPVTQSRQILEQTQKSARSIIDQIALEAGKGLTQAQKKELTRGLTQAFGEITGRFSDNIKKQVALEKKNLDTFYRDQFRNNPDIARRRQLNASNASSIPAQQLPSYISSQQQFLKGARGALSYAINTGDKRLEASASRAVRNLEAGLQAATNNLKAFEKTTKEAAQAAQKAAREQERQAVRLEKERSKPSVEQQMINSRVRQLQQQDVNRKLDGGASLFKNQALLLRNYAVLGGGVAAGYGAAAFSVDLDREFKQLQSILALTNTEMETLEKNLIAVSEKTKFTATEVTEAAIVLGQAGFGQRDIVNAIEGVTLFATAVGSDLKSAVDLATSTLGVFNKDSSQMVDIVDQMTTAVNTSKLNLDKLSLGLQYAGNLAAQSNVSFEETVSALGAMANSGIRSGSTLGTGLRQILITLQNPTEGFKEKVHDLGISMNDLDISTKGLVPVLKTLAERGFTVRDAMATMEVRAAAAYGAFANNVDVAEQLQEKMKIGGAAARANAIQMESLSHQMDRLGSVSKSIVYESLEPLLETVAKLTEKTADFLGQVRLLAPQLSYLATPLAILGGVLAARSVVRLGVGLAGAGGALSSGKGLSGAATALAGRIPMGKAIGGAARFVGVSNPYVLGATALGTAAVYGYQGLSAQAQANDRVDKSRAELSGRISQLETYEKTLKKVNEMTTALVLKQNELGTKESVRREVERLNQEFKNQGLFLDSTVNSYGELISKMDEFSQKTRSARTFLQAESRESYVKANEASLEEMYAAPLVGSFSSNQDLLARGLLAKGKRFYSEAAYGQRSRQFASDLLGGQDIVGVLTGLADQTQAIRPGTQGAVGALASSQESYQSLIGQLMSGLNGDPERVKQLLTGLSPDQAEDAKAYVLDLVKVLQEKAYALAEAKIREEEYNAKDSRLVARENELDALIQKDYVRPLENEMAAVKKQLQDLDQQATNSKEYADAYLAAEKIVAEREASLKNSEVAALKALQDEGADNPQRRLADSGFYQVLGQIESTLNNTLRGLAKSGQPDFEKRTREQLEELDAKIRDRQENLSQNRNEENSQKILEEAIELIRQQENIKTQQLTFAARVNGTSPSSIAQREAAERARVESRARSLTRLRERTLAESRFSEELDARSLIDGSQTKFADSELASLLSDFYREARTDILNDLSEVRIDKEGLLRQADDLDFQAQQQADIVSNTNYTREARQQALRESSNLREQAEQLRQSAIRLEQQGIDEAQRALAELAQYIRDQVIDNSTLSDGEAKNKARNQVTDLEKEVLKLRKDNEGLVEDLEKLRRDVDSRIDQEGVVGRDLARVSPFEGGYRDKVRAAIYGQPYTPESGVETDNTFAGSGQNNIQNGVNFLGQQLDDYYSAYDPLVESLTQLEEMGRGLGTTFGDAFANFATGAMSAKEAARTLFAQLFADLARMASQQVFMSIFKSIFSGGGGTTLDASNSSPFEMTAYQGGPVLVGSYASGGLIRSGLDTRDSTLAHVSRGEFILRKRAVDALGIDTVRALNTANPEMLRAKENAIRTPMMNDKQESEGDINIWLVKESEKPNGLGPRDVLMVFQDDVLKNGQTKQLIKRIQRGDL